LPIRGSVREVGYFYVTLGLGTPSRNFSLIIDTGSTITYVPCSDCKHCGNHEDAAFDVASSSTVVQLGCSTPLCNCGSPPCQCMQNRCYYSRSYAERSSSAGFLLQDHFAFPDAAPPVKLVFGCEADETGEIYRQKADGILGMGNNNNAFQSQLVEQKVIDDTFGLCFGHPSGGTMLLGDVPVEYAERMVYTPLKPGWQVHYYTVTLEALLVDGKALALNKHLFASGYGTVMDSGTTFTYLPTEAFNAFANAVEAFTRTKKLPRTPGADPQYNDICWKDAPKDWMKLDTVFPIVEFEFSGAKVRMLPYRYLFRQGDTSYCLGVFDNGNSGVLVGGVSVRNMLVQYDRRNKRIGFLETDCNNMHIGPQYARAQQAANSSTTPTPTGSSGSTPTPAATGEAPGASRSRSPPPPPPNKKSPPPPPPPTMRLPEPLAQTSTTTPTTTPSTSTPATTPAQVPQNASAAPGIDLTKAKSQGQSAGGLNPGLTQTTEQQRAQGSSDGTGKAPVSGTAEEGGSTVVSSDEVLRHVNGNGAGWLTPRVASLLSALAVVGCVAVIAQILFLYRTQVYSFLGQKLGRYRSVPTLDAPDVVEKGQSGGGARG